MKFKQEDFSRRRPYEICEGLVLISQLISTWMKRTMTNARKMDFSTLAQVLRIPPAFHLSQRSVADGIEGLCMLLRRLAYPCRYGDLIHCFGCPVPILSMATNHVLDYIFNTHGHLITYWNHTLLSFHALQVYANAITKKGLY